MITSPTTTEITKALIAFQKQVGKVAKDAKNPYFKSDYATLSNILEVIKEPLISNGLTFVQFPSGENGLTTRLMHESGEWMEDIYVMTPAKDDPQGRGSAITYQRRYALGAILGLNIDSDDDGNAASLPDRAANPRATKPLTREDKNYASLKAKVLAEHDAGQLEKYKAALMDKPDVVTPVQFKDLIEQIDKKLKRFSVKDHQQDAKQSAELDAGTVDVVEAEGKVDKTSVRI